jgi:hypothetical protein
MEFILFSCLLCLILCCESFRLQHYRFQLNSLFSSRVEKLSTVKFSKRISSSSRSRVEKGGSDDENSSSPDFDIEKLVDNYPLTGKRTKSNKKVTFDVKKGKAPQRETGWTQRLFDKDSRFPLSKLEVGKKYQGRIISIRK